jgi:UDP-N-acetylglucosamine acyltransferase
MSNTHIGHDCTVANDAVIASSVVLAGHVEVGNFARVGGNVALAEWVRIGDHAFIGGQSGIDRDIPPYCVALGVRPKRLRGCNLRALRKTFDPSTVRVIHSIVELWRNTRFTRNEALEQIWRSFEHFEAARTFVDFVSGSRVGVLR